MVQPFGPATVLAKFFGYRDGQGLKGFSAELAELTPEEKLELARLAARELGLNSDQVSFPLA